MSFESPWDLAKIQHCSVQDDNSAPGKGMSGVSTNTRHMGTFYMNPLSVAMLPDRIKEFSGHRNMQS